MEYEKILIPGKHTISGVILLDNCIFCKIIKGEIPSSKVYEDDKVYAFLDISPINKGHTLVIPKNHSKDMLETPDKDLDSCFVISKKLSKAIMKATKADGINLMISSRPAAGQAVFHTHIHLIPRFSGDGLKHWPQGKYKKEEIEEISKKIISNI